MFWFVQVPSLVSAARRRPASSLCFSLFSPALFSSPTRFILRRTQGQQLPIMSSSAVPEFSALSLTSQSHQADCDDPLYGKIPRNPAVGHVRGPLPVVCLSSLIVLPRSPVSVGR